MSVTRDLLTELDERRARRLFDRAPDGRRQGWSLGGSATAAAAALPRNVPDGLRLRYASASTFVVETGKIRDRSDSYNLTLSAEVTVDFAAFAGINKLDRKTGPGTVTNVATAVVGTGTTFTTDFGPYAGSGTLSTGGVPGTTVTGTGTHFLSEIAAGDMIGNGSQFSRVTAIASDTSCTVSTAITLGAGSNYRIIENATMRVNTYTCSKVNFITDDTNLTLATDPGTNGTGVAWYIGDECASTYFVVHLLYGTSGTGAIVSTQRTTPFWAMTGYATARRRIGWVYNDASNNLFAWVHDAERWTIYEATAGTAGLQPIANGTGSAATWVRYVAGVPTPPGAGKIRLSLTRSGGSAMYMGLRATSQGTTAYHPCFVLGGADNVGGPIEVPVDGVGAFDVQQSAGTTGVYGDVHGYYDNLEKWK